jgi:Uma2 family endonuclease
MNALPKRQMLSAEAFLEWAEAQDEGRYQLIAGEIVAQSPERAEHGHVNFQVAKAFEAAIAKAKLPCRPFVDSLAVKIVDTTVFLPDALVSCGAPIARSSLVAPNPIIVAEVISPTSTRRDLALKLANYFRRASVQHYLIVLLENRTVIQHSRGEGEALRTRIEDLGGRLSLDPPGLTIAVSDLFGDLDTAFADEWD